MMTDAQADIWFQTRADFSMMHTLLLTTYQLWRKGQRGEPEADTVGFVIPENMVHPNQEEARRFLVRWFVNAFGP